MNGKRSSGTCGTKTRYLILFRTHSMIYHLSQSIYAAENAPYQPIDQHGPNSPSALSTPFNPIPSPPPGSAVRRHQSLTYGTATTGVKKTASAGLRRAGTLQNQGRTHGHQPQTPSPTGADEEYAEGSTGHESESYFDRQVSSQSQQYPPTSPISRSPWSTPSNEWRPSGGNANLVGSNNGNTAIDEVQRGLSSMDINSQGYSTAAFSVMQSGHPPRFNPNQTQQFTLQGAPPNDSNGGAAHKLQLITNLDERANNQLPGSSGSSGPVSASAYVPAVGHGIQQSTGQQQRGGTGEPDERAFTASGTWDQKERVLHTRSSNPNINYGSNTQQQQQQKGQVIPSVPPIPAQFLQANQQNLRLGLNTQMGGLGAVGAQPGMLTSPVDIPTLIATKGYNPQNFDTHPTFVRPGILSFHLDF
jgi:hypothetical protein